MGITEQACGGMSITFRAISAFGFDVSHRENSRLWQKKQDPQEMVKGTTTRSPGLSGPAAPEPASIVGISPPYKCRSEREIGVAVTLIIAVARLNNLRIGNGVNSDIACAVPTESFHSSPQTYLPLWPATLPNEHVSRSL